MAERSEAKKGRPKIPYLDLHSTHGEFLWPPSTVLAADHPDAWGLHLRFTMPLMGSERGSPELAVVRELGPSPHRFGGFFIFPPTVSAGWGLSGP